MTDKPKSNRLIVLFAVLLTLIVASVFIVGIGKYRKVQTLQKHCTASTYGLVTTVDRTERHSDIGASWEKIYYIEAEFYVNDVKYIASAEERRGENDYGENARFKEETNITIMYNPSDPDENYIKAAIMDTGKREMLAGVLVPVVLIFLTIDYRRKKRMENDS